MGCFFEQEAAFLHGPVVVVLAVRAQVRIFLRDRVLVGRTQRLLRPAVPVVRGRANDALLGQAVVAVEVDSLEQVGLVASGVVVG